MERRKPWSQRAALLLASSGIGLLVAEGTLRLLRPPLVERDHQPAIYQPDPELGFRYAPGSEGVLERLEFRVPVRINAAGYFDDEFRLERVEGVGRLAVLGDSFVAGFHVGRGRTFPDRLELLLGQAGEGGRWEVLNFGLAGSGTTQQRAVLERDVLAYAPDLVVLAFYANDIADVQHGLVMHESYRGFKLSYRDPADRDALAAQVDALVDGTPALLWTAVERSFLVRAVYNLLSGARRHGAGPSLTSNRARAQGLGAAALGEAEALARIAEAVRAMERSCREAGAGFLFLVIPSAREVEGRAALAAQPLLEALGRRGVRTLSLLEGFRERSAAGQRLYWERDGHCNEAGHALIAEQLAAAVSGDREPER